MLVDPVIEHIDPSVGDDSLCIEVMDATGETKIIYFTDMAALWKFSQDLAFAVEGYNHASIESRAYTHTPTVKKLIPTSSVN